MLIAVPAETQTHEKRVAATPETVAKFIAAGCTAVVERGAGQGARFSDAAYEKAGAHLAEDFRSTCADAALLLKVAPLSSVELKQVARNTAVVSFAHPFSNLLLKDYADAGLTCFSMEMIPRISRAQSMDVLSSQANIAGYKAVLLAMEHYSRFMPMLMTAAGTVQPARVLILGAGVAGLQAVATARRMGAMVEVFDVRTAAKEQVESLGARFVEVESDQSAEDAGGYAKEMDDDYKRRQSDLVAEHAAKADIIITTALIPGKPAPLLITEDMVQSMRAGSVIVDLAVEMGGNCSLSEMDQVVEKYGVTLVGVGNIPSLMATDASQLYARNILNFIQPMIGDDGARLQINLEDEITAASLICQSGEFLKPDLLGMEVK